jgi:hypothetical protein
MKWLKKYRISKTKKIISIFIVVSMFGCKNNHSLVSFSDITVVKIESEKITDLYISDKGYGPYLYDTWRTGVYGNEIKVFLLDSVEFKKLYKSARNKNTDYQKSGQASL